MDKYQPGRSQAAAAARPAARHPNEIPPAFQESGKLSRMKDAFIHDKFARRRMIIQTITYFIALGILLVYISLQATRVNAEQTVNQTVLSLKNLTMPGIVWCHNPNLDFEPFDFHHCNVFTGGVFDGPAYRYSCSSLVKPVKARFAALSKKPLEQCFMIPPNSITFKSTLNAIELLTLVSIRERMFISSLVFFQLFDKLDSNGEPSGLGMPMLTTSGGTVFTVVTISRYKGITDTKFHEEFAMSTSSIPMRHNYTVEMAEAAVNWKGGVETEFLAHYIVVSSMDIQCYESTFSYTVSDFLGQIGGIFGMIGTAVALVLGKGAYDPSGLVHRAKIIPLQVVEPSSAHEAASGDDGPPGIGQERAGSIRV